METKIVFSKWIAYKLRLKGFKILKTLPNYHQPNLDCWVFEDTPEFEQAFGAIVKEGQRHDN